MSCSTRRTTATVLTLASTAALLVPTTPQPAAAISTPAPDTRISITVDGRVRTARVHVPIPTPDLKKMPLVLAFHGRLGDGNDQEKITHFNSVADANGFLAVYPDGYQRSWNDGRKNTPSNRDGVRDVAFVRALVKRLVTTYSVDKHQVFAIGMSNGGFFAQRLGCVMAGKFAAIATVASVMPRPLAKTCTPSDPLPVLMIMGTDDPLVPYSGGDFGSGKVLSAKATARLWRSLANCHKPRNRTLRDRDPQDGTTVSLLTANRCAGDASVKLYTVHGGGHTWPGGRQYLPRTAIGRTSRDFDASKAIWLFLHDKRRENRPKA